jgi:PEGA domain
MSDPTTSRSSVSTFALVVGGMVAVAAVILLVVRAGGSGEVAAPPEGPAMANIDIVSDPVGASVFLADDGGLIGTAPLTITRPQSDKELVVITRHEGYQDRRSTIPLFAANGRVDIELIRIGEKERPVPQRPDGWTP